MKRYSVFRNAKKMLEGGLVRKDAESDNSAYYVVVDPNSHKEHQVRVEFDNDSKVLGAGCDCTISSIKCKHSPLCSHIMAALCIAVNEYGGEKR